MPRPMSRKNLFEAILKLTEKQLLKDELPLAAVSQLFTATADDDPRYSCRRKDFMLFYLTQPKNVFSSHKTNIGMQSILKHFLQRNDISLIEKTLATACLALAYSLVGEHDVPQERKREKGKEKETETETEINDTDHLLQALTYNPGSQILFDALHAAIIRHIKPSQAEKIINKIHQLVKFDKLFDLSVDQLILVMQLIDNKELITTLNNTLLAKICNYTHRPKFTYGESLKILSLIEYIAPDFGRTGSAEEYANWLCGLILKYDTHQEISAKAMSVFTECVLTACGTPYLIRKISELQNIFLDSRPLPIIIVTPKQIDEIIKSNQLSHAPEVFDLLLCHSVRPKEKTSIVDRFLKKLPTRFEVCESDRYNWHRIERINQLLLDGYQFTEPQWDTLEECGKSKELLSIYVTLNKTRQLNENRIHKFFKTRNDKISKPSCLELILSIVKDKKNTILPKTITSIINRMLDISDSYFEPYIKILEILADRGLLTKKHFEQLSKIFNNQTEDDKNTEGSEDKEELSSDSEGELEDEEELEDYEVNKNKKAIINIMRIASNKEQIPDECIDNIINNAIVEIQAILTYQSQQGWGVISHLKDPHSALKLIVKQKPDRKTLLLVLADNLFSLIIRCPQKEQIAYNYFTKPIRSMQSDFKKYNKNSIALLLKNTDATPLERKVAINELLRIAEAEQTVPTFFYDFEFDFIKLKCNFMIRTQAADLIAILAEKKKLPTNRLRQILEILTSFVVPQLSYCKNMLNAIDKVLPILSSETLDNLPKELLTTLINKNIDISSFHNIRNIIVSSEISLIDIFTGAIKEIDNPKAIKNGLNTLEYLIKYFPHKTLTLINVEKFYVAEQRTVFDTLLLQLSHHSSTTRIAAAKVIAHIIQTMLSTYCALDSGQQELEFGDPQTPESIKRKIIEYTDKILSQLSFPASSTKHNTNRHVAYILQTTAVHIALNKHAKFWLEHVTRRPVIESILPRIQIILRDNLTPTGLIFSDIKQLFFGLDPEFIPKRKSLMLLYLQAATHQDFIEHKFNDFWKNCLPKFLCRTDISLTEKKLAVACLAVTEILTPITVADRKSKNKGKGKNKGKEREDEADITTTTTTVSTTFNHTLKLLTNDLNSISIALRIAVSRYKQKARSQEATENAIDTITKELEKAYLPEFPFKLPPKSMDLRLSLYPLTYNFKFKEILLAIELINDNDFNNQLYESLLKNMQQDSTTIPMYELRFLSHVKLKLSEKIADKHALILITHYEKLRIPSAYNKSIFEDSLSSILSTCSISMANKIILKWLHIYAPLRISLELTQTQINKIVESLSQATVDIEKLNVHNLFELIKNLSASYTLTSTQITTIENLLQRKFEWLIGSPGSGVRVPNDDFYNITILIINCLQTLFKNNPLKNEDITRLIEEIPSKGYSSRYNSPSYAMLKFTSVAVTEQNPLPSKFVKYIYESFLATNNIYSKCYYHLIKILMSKGHFAPEYIPEIIQKLLGSSISEPRDIITTYAQNNQLEPKHIQQCEKLFISGKYTIHYILHPTMENYRFSDNFFDKLIELFSDKNTSFLTRPTFLNALIKYVKYYILTNEQLNALAKLLLLISHPKKACYDTIRDSAKEMIKAINPLQIQDFVNELISLLPVKKASTNTKEKSIASTSVEKLKKVEPDHHAYITVASTITLLIPKLDIDNAIAEFLKTFTTIELELLQTNSRSNNSDSSFLFNPKEVLLAIAEKGLLTKEHISTLQNLLYKKYLLTTRLLSVKMLCLAVQNQHDVSINLQENLLINLLSVCNKETKIKILEFMDILAQKNMIAFKDEGIISILKSIISNTAINIYDNITQEIGEINQAEREAIISYGLSDCSYIIQSHAALKTKIALIQATVKAIIHILASVSLTNDQFIKLLQALSEASIPPLYKREFHKIIVMNARLSETKKPLSAIVRTLIKTPILRETTTKKPSLLDRSIYYIYRRMLIEKIQQGDDTAIFDTFKIVCKVGGANILSVIQDITAQVVGCPKAATWIDFMANVPWHGLVNALSELTLRESRRETLRASLQNKYPKSGYIDTWCNKTKVSIVDDNGYDALLALLQMSQSMFWKAPADDLNLVRNIQSTQTITKERPRSAIIEFLQKQQTNDTQSKPKIAFAISALHMLNHLELYLEQYKKFNAKAAATPARKGRIFTSTDKLPQKLPLFRNPTTATQSTDSSDAPASASSLYNTL